MDGLRPATLRRVLVLLALALVFPATSAAQPARKPVRGEAQFRASCIGCHSMSCNRMGPKLLGLFDRKAGGVPDYKAYTDALRNASIVWNDDTLDALLRDPDKLVPGTSMAYIRITRAEDRRDIIAFLRRQDTSVDLCY